jgi:hypothetical protein
MANSREAQAGSESQPHLLDTLLVPESDSPVVNASTISIMSVQNQNHETQPDASRREFIKQSSTAVAAFTIVPRHVLGGPGFVPPSEKVNIALIGAGRQGAGQRARLDGPA